MIKRPADEPLVQQPINSAFVVKNTSQMTRDIKYTVETNIDFTGCAFGNGRFIIVGTRHLSDHAESNYGGGVMIISDDYGDTWKEFEQPLFIGFAGVVYGNGVFVVTGILNNLINGNNHGIIRSVDNGMSWELADIDADMIIQGNRHYSPYRTPGSSSLRGASRSAVMAYCNGVFAMNTDSVFNTRNGFVLKSNNNGASWELPQNNIAAVSGSNDKTFMGYTGVAIRHPPASGLNLYHFFVGSNITSSTDTINWGRGVEVELGISFQPTSAVFGDRAWVYSLFEPRDNYNYIYNIYRSANNGSSINLAFTSNNVVTAVASFDSNIFIVFASYGMNSNTNGSMLISYDDGITWFESSLGVPRMNVYSACSGDNVFICIGKTSNLRSFIIRVKNEEGYE